MDNLKDILSAVLRDVVLAQHQANLFARSLAPAYEAGGDAEGLALPGVALGELELNLRYAVKGGLEVIEEEESADREQHRVLRYVARESAALLVNVLARTIQDSGMDYHPEFDFIDALPQNKAFINHFYKRIYVRLAECPHALMADSKRFDEKKLGTAVMQVAADQLLLNDDLKPLFAQPGGKQLSGLLSKKLALAVSAEMDDFLRESTLTLFRRLQRFGSLPVEIDADALAQYPDTAVQTLRIKVDAQTWTETETNEE